MKKIVHLLLCIIVMCLSTAVYLAALTCIVYNFKLDAWAAKLGVSMSYAFAGFCGGRSSKGKLFLPPVIYWSGYVLIMRMIAYDDMKSIWQLILILIMVCSSYIIGACSCKYRKKRAFHK